MALSKPRKINLIITAICAIAFATMIATGWALGGCEFKICAVGAIFGFTFPLGIGCCIDDVLIK